MRQLFLLFALILSLVSCTKMYTEDPLQMSSQKTGDGWIVDPCIADPIFVYPSNHFKMIYLPYLNNPYGGDGEGIIDESSYFWDGGGGMSNNGGSGGNSSGGGSGGSPPPGSGGTLQKDILITTRNYLKTSLTKMDSLVIAETDSISSGNLGEMIYVGRQFFDDSPIIIKIRPGLTRMQQMFVIPHEFAHSILIDMARQAGSWAKLAIQHPRLVVLYEKFSRQTSEGRKYDFNRSQHEWLSENIDWYESILRGIFPGQNEDFYRNGRWSSLTDTDIFNNLPIDDQAEIKDYLGQNNL